jgi:hypothetical protein
VTSLIVGLIAVAIWQALFIWRLTRRLREAREKINELRLLTDLQTTGLFTVDPFRK